VKALLHAAYRSLLPSPTPTTSCLELDHRREARSTLATLLAVGYLLAIGLSFERAGPLNGSERRCAAILHSVARDFL